MKLRILEIVLGSALFALVCGNAYPGRMSATDADNKSPAALAAQIPLAGRVTDAANVLSQQQQAALETSLANLERNTQHQLVVVTVHSLNGQDIADYTRNLANSWRIGRREYNDGVVVLVAPNERKVRIAVGYGLERRLPDSVCQQIIDRNMLPHFRRGDLPGGISEGTTALIKLLEKVRHSQQEKSLAPKMIP